MQSATVGMGRVVAASVVDVLGSWGDISLATGQHAAHWLERVLDHIDYGIACVDEMGRLLHANRAAREAWPSVHPEREPLRSAIRAASSHGTRRLVEAGEGERGFRVAVVPLSEAAESSGHVLLLLSKSSMCERLSSYWYGVAKGLTGAELGVLEGIAEGWSPRDLAQRNRVSLATIRTQIASVREKTGAVSIYALLREVAQLPPIRCAATTGSRSSLQP